MWVDLTSLGFPFDVFYNTSPSAPIVKIDLDIKIEGAFVVDKSFSDFYVVTLSPYSWGVDFAFYKKQGITSWDVLEIFSLFKEDIDINIILRSDTTYEIELS